MKAEIEKAFVSVRVGITQWMPEHRFRQLLALLRTYRGIADEITFFRLSMLCVPSPCSLAIVGFELNCPYSSKGELDL